MPVILDKIINGNRIRIFDIKGKTYYEYYQGKSYISKTLLCDEFGKELEDIEYDSSGKILSHFRREYTENSFTETFRSKLENYTRNFSIRFISGYKHIFDRFNSFTHPEKNNIKDYVYNENGNLIRILNNGKMFEIS